MAAPEMRWEESPAQSPNVPSRVHLRGHELSPVLWRWLRRDELTPEELWPAEDDPDTEEDPRYV